MRGVEPALAPQPLPTLLRSARRVVTASLGLGLAVVLSSCGGGPVSSPDPGVGCSVTVLIPSSGNTLLGSVRAQAGGISYDFVRNSNTIPVACGELASLSVTAADPSAHPFTGWSLLGRSSRATSVTVTVDGLVSVRPDFKVARRPVSTPTPRATLSPSAVPSPSSATVTLDQWVSYDAAARTVTWKLVAAYQAVNHGLSFDGESNGAMKVTVPIGWSVTVDFSNGGTINHSAAVVPPAGTTLVFPGAESPSPMQGTAPGATAIFTFSASQAGGYRMACLMPGHEAAGMWESLTVSTGGLPTVQL